MIPYAKKAIAMTGGPYMLSVNKTINDMKKSIIPMTEPESKF